MKNKILIGTILLVLLGFPAFTEVITLEDLLKQGKSGDLAAQINLGSFFSNSKNPEDSLKAEQWYLKAARQGDPNAQAALGGMYLNGFKKIPKKTEMAVVWLSKAAEQNHIKAQFLLGSVLNQKKSEHFDPVAAEKWITMSAQKGFAQSQYLKAMMCFNADDFKGAEKWHLKAAKQSLMHSALQLGLLYYFPEMAGQDYVKSYAWLTIARNAGQKKAEKYLVKLEEKLNAKQLESAEKLIKELQK